MKIHKMKVAHLASCSSFAKPVCLFKKKIKNLYICRTCFSGSGCSSPPLKMSMSASSKIFSKYSGYTDMVFSLRQLQEKCREQQQPLFVAFIDLTKAFDLVSRDNLLKIL